MSDEVDKLLENELPSVNVQRSPTGPTPKSPSPHIEVDAKGVRRFKGYVIPPEANRIKVIDQKGQIKLRKIADIQQGDTPSLNNEGVPVFMEGAIGKPPKKLDEVLPPATALIGDILKIKEGHLRNDPIIHAAENSPESPELLNQVVLAIGEEAASLRFERMEAERRGTDTTQLSMKRVASLKAMADTWIKRREQIQSRTVDIESPSFRALFEYITETFTRAMQSAGIRQELADSVISVFAKMLDDTWKNEAKNRMKE
jgi:hypothetical protein